MSAQTLVEEQHQWTSQQLKEKAKDTKEKANTKERAKAKERAREDTRVKGKDTKVTERVQLVKAILVDQKDNHRSR